MCAGGGKAFDPAQLFSSDQADVINMLQRLMLALTKLQLAAQKDAIEKVMQVMPCTPHPMSQVTQQARLCAVKPFFVYSSRSCPTISHWHPASCMLRRLLEAAVWPTAAGFHICRTGTC